MIQPKALFVALFFSVVAIATPHAAHAGMINSDIVIFMDESGSTGNAAQPGNGYSTLLQSNVFSYLSAFDAVLTDRGIDANFALVGFGGSNSFVNLVTAEFTSASNVTQAAKSLIASGDSMGIYSAISVALNNLNFAADAIKNFIVFTDEEASDLYTPRETAEQLLTSNNVALNSVVDGGASSDLAQLALRTGGDYFDINSFKDANDAQARLLMEGLAGVKADEINSAFCTTHPTAVQCQAARSEVSAPAGIGLMVAGIALVLIRRQRNNVSLV